MHPHGGGGGGGHGGGHFGDGSTKTQVFLTTGGGHGSVSSLQITCGAGFLGCSVTISRICCGLRLTVTLSITSPGGVGFLFTCLVTIGSGVGSLIVSTFLFGGDTLQPSSAHGGGAGGGHPQDIFEFLIDLSFLRYELFFKFLKNINFF